MHYWIRPSCPISNTTMIVTYRFASEAMWPSRRIRQWSVDILMGAIWASPSLYLTQWILWSCIRITWPGVTSFLSSCPTAKNCRQRSCHVWKHISGKQFRKTLTKNFSLHILMERLKNLIHPSGNVILQFSKTVKIQKQCQGKNQGQGDILQTVY